MAFLGFSTCISFVAVFLAAARPFLNKNNVPGILVTVLAVLRSSRLPQGVFFQQKWRSWDFVRCIKSVGVFPAAARAFLATIGATIGHYWKLLAAIGAYWPLLGFVLPTRTFLNLIYDIGYPVESYGLPWAPFGYPWACLSSGCR